MDFEKLRQQTLGSTQEEEAVTVNTRALIDKVLARYSGEHTTLRELIQNSADAQATTVKVKFETIPSPNVPLANTTNPSEVIKHVLLNHTLRRLVVSNDGVPFTSADWNRLKKIAEGNPDVEKIGAFGVGFYSVFADCENPFVTSGNEAMAFYWKENSLFTRRLKLSPEETNTDTSFVLDYRSQTSAVPALLPLCQFLATSITFVALQGIELWLDDWKVLSLTKKTSPGLQLSMPRSVDRKTKDGLMTLTGLEKQGIQLDATVMGIIGFKPSTPAKPSSFGETYSNVTSDMPSIKSFFSRFTTSTSSPSLKGKAGPQKEKPSEVPKEDLTTITTANVFLRVTTATIKTSVSKSFAAELERATKKPPPSTTRLSILTSSYDDLSASSLPKSGVSVDVFASVHPTKKPGGRVFIGFPTFQTTGGGFHLSAPSLIPTVERESADLQARWVRNWNIELLRVAGIMTRLAFQNEMNELGEDVRRAALAAGHGTKINAEVSSKFTPNALHILNTFSIKESTPSAQVGQIIEEAFWTAFRQPSIEIFSTRGVLQTSEVRIETEDVSGFVDGIPVVPKDLMSATFVQKLKEFAILTQVNINDIKQELEAKALTRQQLVKFLFWLGPKASSGSLPASTARSLMDVTVAMLSEEEGKGQVLALSAVNSYSNPNKIPADLPIPPTTLPHDIIRGMNVTHLNAIGLEELKVMSWLDFIIDLIGQSNEEQDITKSATFAAHFLAVMSKNWESLGATSKQKVVSILSPLVCVPTRYGVKRPTEAYFPSVKLFDDLPIVTNCPGVKEKFLSAIGVRKAVELEVIFNRLLHTAPSANGDHHARKWSHVELIKYLASVREDIPVDDMKRLKESRICPAEAGPSGKEMTKGSDVLYRFSELFEPKDALRDLDLPIIQWPGPPAYRVSSPEGRFLAYLGLRPYPTTSELVSLMASENLAMRQKAMIYYISNHHSNHYGFGVDTNKSFLPLQGNDKKLVASSDCYTNQASALLGFNILREDLHLHAAKFGVAENPPMSVCVKKLLSSPPKDRRSAIELFNYFATRLGEIESSQAQTLSQARIVPVAPRAQSTRTSEKQVSNVRYITPQQSFLGDSETYREIFDYVDFGNQANAFLLRCGAKQQPSKVEIAALVCQEPARLLSVFQSPEKYLNLLKTLAEDVSTIKQNKVLWKQMRIAPFLLGMKEIPSQKNEKIAEPKSFDDDDMDDDDAPIRQYVLARPSELLIVDDYSSFQHFRHSDLLYAPMDDTLESFYASLGVPGLANCIEKKLSIGNLAETQRPAARLSRLVLERTKLFLHDCPRDAIKHDSRWLEHNLSFQAVNGISMRRTVKGRNLSHVSKQTAAINHDLRKGWTLYITTQFDYYEVSEILCNLLLLRPKAQEYTFLETMMTKSLYDLKDRGFNVDRILRAKAALERIAEEERRKQLEAEQQQIKEQEQSWLANNQAPVPVAGRQSVETPDYRIPGAFEAEDRPPAEVHKKPRGLFADLQRRFGLEKPSETQDWNRNQNPQEGSSSQPDAPPSYEETQRGPHVNQTERRPGEVERVTAPHELHRNLVNAVQSSRAHDSTSLFSPPRDATIKEQASYCDPKPGQNISFLADASNGMRVYISKSVAAQTASNFLGQNANALNMFSTILQDVGDVFSMSKKALHVYYDEAGNTIAFNSQGSVFCNFRFYLQLHAKSADRGANGKIEAAIYWWTTLCHELAHNLVEDHSAAHSFYTESFVTQYFPKMAQMASKYMSQETSHSTNNSKLIDLDYT